MFSELINFTCINFVVREEEVKKLQQILSVDKATFTVVYGRSRLG